MNCQNKRDKHGCGEHSMEGHPCFNKAAHHKVGRMHLPVAPKCNIKCNYCTRKHDCANESRPGVTSRILTPQQALEKVREVVALDQRIKVAGIAGPGDPLANPETLETFRLVGREFPDLIKCLSTNGLMLPEKIDELAQVGLDSLTVTVNAVDPEIGAKIYSWVRYHGQTMLGSEAAELLITNQFMGIEKAVDKGITVKVNSVYIPGVNDGQMELIAKRIKELGVTIMNIMPLIPQADFAHLLPPTKEQIDEVRSSYAPIIKQMEHCRQCRADAIGLLS